MAHYYRQLEAERQRQWAVRQERRRIDVEKINAATPDGEYVAGFHWRIAWIKAQTCLFIEGRYDEMEGAQEWMQRKLRIGLNAGG